VFDSKGNITDVVKIATDVTDAVNDKKKIDELSKNLQTELANSEICNSFAEIMFELLLSKLIVPIFPDFNKSSRAIALLNKLAKVSTTLSMLTEEFDAEVEIASRAV
jgi:hypothetical protein